MVFVEYSSCFIQDDVARLKKNWNDNSEKLIFINPPEECATDYFC